MNKFCECCCGGEVKNDKRFIHGHNSKGAKLSPEHRKKLSVSNMGKVRSREQRKRISESHKNFKVSDQAKEKISKTLKGHIVTKETRGKISKALKGGKISEAQKIAIGNANRGRIPTEETKAKLSIAHKGLKHTKEAKRKIGLAHSGKRCNFWNGGTAHKPYGIEWILGLKNNVKERDGYECQNPHCLNEDSLLNVHHIDYDKRRCASRNLITLCRSCNSRSNFNRDYWQNIYSQIMKRRRLE